MQKHDWPNLNSNCPPRPSRWGCISRWSSLAIWLTSLATVPLNPTKSQWKSKPSLKSREMQKDGEPWHKVINVEEVPSPALLIYPERVEENIRRMIRIAGDVQRLRPHMKTHKLPEVIGMQLAQGITKFKCATIA